MKVCEADSKINALQVTEISITNFPDTGIVVNATYALAEYDETLQKTIHTHGKCTANPKNWSDDTMQLLKELISSMETDLLPRHFEIRNNPNTEKTNAETRTTTGRLEEADQV